jgi:hypothetical protein
MNGIPSYFTSFGVSFQSSSGFIISSAIIQYSLETM